MKSVYGRPIGRRATRYRTLESAAAVALMLAIVSGVAATPAEAAKNSGTGDSGFFTFRPATQTAGSQVNVASGNLLVRTRDLSDSPLTYDVVVDRVYNSLAPDAFSILSPRWSFDVGPSTKITEQAGGNVVVDGPSGYGIPFARQADGSYQAPVGFDGSLAKTSTGWTLLRSSQSDQFGFDTQGILATTKDSQARDFTVQNTSAAGRTVLSSYGTSTGRRVNVSYTGDSLVREVDDPASGHHYYTYTAGKLTGYQDPAGPQTNYHYTAGGLLDKITQPDGTTVDLVMHASGKVQSTTSTVPGGVPQTTSFVYARRPYKTDVTVPDSVRRTYAYDDDWRVTRQYNPDVAPGLTASGDLRDLADQYVNGNRTYPITIAADEPDGAGLTHLGLERSGGVEIVGTDPPCTDTPFDHICPTSFTAQLQADLSSVPEGRQTLHGAVVDDEQHHEISTPWDVIVDRTAPGVASNFQLSYFDPADAGASATITWTGGSDPDLAEGTPGSGVDSTQARYSINGGAFTAWEPSDSGNVAVVGGHNGDQVAVEVRATDLVGNVSAVGSGMIALSLQLEDPVLQQQAAEYVVNEYGGTIAQAVAWLGVQDQAERISAGNLSAQVSDAAPHGFGGIWYDNAARRVVVALTGGTPHGPVQQVIQDRGIAASTDITSVTYTQRQLEVAQPAIEQQLEDLIDAGLVGISRDVTKNRIEIEVATSATSGQRNRIQAAANSSPVAVGVVQSTLDSLAQDPQDCYEAYCDKPLRGGILMGRQRETDIDVPLCTAGFVARDRDSGLPRIMTAGHCVEGMGSSWATMSSSQLRVQHLGARVDAGVLGGRGDAAAIAVDDSSPFRQALAPIVFVRKSATGSTARKTNYDIRAVSGSKPGTIMCVQGGYSNSSHCLTGDKFDQNVRYTTQLTVGHLGVAKGCGTIEGDSGGPLVRGHKAYGILTTGPRDEHATGEKCRSSYQGAAGAENLLGINISLRR